jgi:hypothetical protein
MVSKLWYPSYGIQDTILNNKMLDGRLRSDMTAACSNQAWRFLYLKNCVKTRTSRFRNLKNPGLKPSYGLELGPKVLLKREEPTLAIRGRARTSHSPT